MNKIVRSHYPAAKLPPDLRAGLPQEAKVRVTVVVEADEADAETLLDQLAAFRAGRADREISRGEAVKRVRELRDEWDD